VEHTDPGGVAGGTATPDDLSMMDSARRYGVECLGTALLVFFGVGSAVAGRIEGGVVVVALAFGFVLLALMYAIGPVSGCHVNPAVTLGALVARRTTLNEALAYWAAQFVGAIAASAILWGLVRWGDVLDQTGALGATGYGVRIDLGGTMVLETILTFLLVLVVLMVTTTHANAAVAGVCVGLTLAVGNLVGVPLDGASMNPARSLGPALFVGGTALTQLWVFIVFPALGGVLAALTLPLVRGDGWRDRNGVEVPPVTGHNQSGQH
jgi:aquaporin Z